MYQIGRIAKTHGVKGEVKVSLTTDFDRFIVGKTIYYYQQDQKIYLTIESVRPQQTMLLVKFKELNSLNEVETLTQKLLYTAEEPPLGEDEYTRHQLIGMTVVSTEGETIGVVKNVMFLPSQEVLVIERDQDKDALIPFLKEFVIEVSDKIVVKLIEGLIW